jgi:hypothetical protein
MDVADLAQSVERWLVEPDVAGSSPVVRPKVKAPYIVRSFYFGLEEREPVVRAERTRVR